MDIEYRLKILTSSFFQVFVFFSAHPVFDLSDFKPGSAPRSAYLLRIVWKRAMGNFPALLLLLPHFRHWLMNWHPQSSIYVCYFITFAIQSLIIIAINTKMEKKKGRSKIGHSLQELEEGLILTLQDNPILLNGQINENADVLENFEKRRENEAEHNRLLKDKIKTIANAATSHLESKNEGEKKLLPHYDDHQYKSDEVDLQNGTVVKRSRPKPSKNMLSDFESNNNVNTEYYQRSSKFKQRKGEKNSPADLLQFLNDTAVEKDDNEVGRGESAEDIIEQSLNEVRKRKNVEREINSNLSAQSLVNEDEEFLTKALRKSHQARHQSTLLDIIRQEDDSEEKQPNKYTEIQLNPVSFKPSDMKRIDKKYDIKDAVRGTTSCLYVNLPSQKLSVKKEEALPDSFKEISPEQLEKMRQQVSFLEDRQVGVGLAQTLNYLRQNNLLEKEEQFGRTNDEASNYNKPQDRVKIQYRNASGKLMKPKEAFRYMSAIFHGQGPGKNKVEKLKRKQLQEMRIKQAASGQGKLMSLLERHQSKTGEAHMVIELGSKNKKQE